MKHNTDMKGKLKILVASHKPDKVYADDVYTPIHVGRAISKFKEEMAGMIGDDYGDIFYPEDDVEDYSEYQAQLSDTLVIRGYKKSTAQKLAKNLAKKQYAPNHVKFEVIK